MTSLSESPQPAIDQHFSHPKYRPDIDGLRAIAVLSVVAFHAFPSLIKGGFVGVDEFFVISGFLISTIILGNLENNKFSFINFYSRRINRIFPALLLVLISTLIVGWFVLLADEYTQLGKHIAGGSAFISNFVLRGEAGYFDNSADTKPLIHLWSLGIEEQFYLIWPLMIWAAFKTRLNTLILIILVGCASLALNIINITVDPVATFYSPQTRFWELLIGSFLAYVTMYKSQLFPKWRGVSGPRIRNIQSFIGLACLVSAFTLTTKGDHFPGWWALLPTTGAALIIAAGPFTSFNRIVLSNKILVWLGLISFPLYLWHWPLLSFVHIIEGGVEKPATRMLAVSVAVLLAWLTYKYIEQPLRHGGKGNIKTIILTGLMLITGLTGYITYANDGFKFRLSDRAEFSDYFENSLPERKYFTTLNIKENFRVDCEFYDAAAYLNGESTNAPVKEINKSCYQKQNPDSKSLFIWGDSHAQQLYSGLKKELPKNWEILQVASSGCPASPDESAPSKTDYCAQSNWFAVEQIKSVIPDVVIVGQNANHAPETLRRIFDLLKKTGVKRVIFTGPTPHWATELPKTIVKSLWVKTPRFTLIGLDHSVLEKNNSLKNNQIPSGAIFADIISIFCNENGCMTYLGDDIKTGITSWDYGHLTPVASDFLAKKLLVKLVTGD
ncbi:acyltransferase family protein [Pseudomonas sp. UMAB-40]|uniref:acyltransferase family protein n=1 Tax=Pseudomonas sp. UMAB-40 TaxID=1365407 RepID=UPI001C580602|nr:acyltransferase family protein [Pseudomonas sp. UMAB-40]